jgi:hypothetical protein
MWSSIIPDPLHAAVVHLPKALVILLPLGVAGSIVAIRRGAPAKTVWGVAILAHALLAGSAWLSLATGDPAKDRVEHVVAEAPIESHEEAAEAFLAVAAGALVLSLVGARRDRIGRLTRVASAAASVGLVALGWNVGHSGGQLVYRYGAAGAYTSPSAANGSAGPAKAGRAGDDDAH